MSISMQYAAPEAPQPERTAGAIAALVQGRLYALQHPYALDGRVSSYPASARGFSVANSYLLTQSDAAMLIDTGFGKDEAAIRGEIESLIAPGLPLSLFPLRLNEFMSINNVETFAGHFNVEQCYTSNTDAALWFDFGAKQNGRSILDAMPVTAVTRADTIWLGKQGRGIDVMQAPIRLIATRWLYDRATRTLFSSDLFTHVWRAHAHGPWIVTEAKRHHERARAAIVHAEHALLVAGGRADRRDPPRHRRGVRRSTTSRRSRPATAASCPAARSWRGMCGCWTRFSKVWTRASRCRATCPATRSAEHGEQDAARDRARRVLDRRLPGAAPQGQGLSRLQRGIPDRRRHRVMPGGDRPPQGFSRDRAAHERAVRPRRATAANTCSSPTRRRRIAAASAAC